MHHSEYARELARSSTANCKKNISNTTQTSTDSWHIHGGKDVVFTSWAFRQTPECALSMSTFSPAWEVVAGAAGAVDAGV